MTRHPTIQSPARAGIRRLFSLLAALTIGGFAGVAVAAETEATPKYHPPAIAPEAVLPGTIKQLTFSQSAIFPGTVREVTVFIPAQYDGAKPACVYVKTDGYSPKEKALLETMIATKEMPVTIGVFVRPGELPAPMKGTIGRRNRDFEYEYDTVTTTTSAFSSMSYCPMSRRSLR